MNNGIDVTIIIVSYNTKRLLEACLHSIYKNINGLNFEVIVVDNNSKDDSQEMVKNNFSHVKLIQNNENIGFSKANNQAIRLAEGRFILLLNSDTLIMSKKFDLMVSFIEEHQRVGVLGPKLVDPEGSPQISIDKFPTPFAVFLRFCVPRVVSTGLKNFIDSSNLKNFLGNRVKTYFTFNNINFPIEVDMISGACMLVKKEIIEQVGLLDENFFLYSEDVDWCFRIKKAGWKIVWLPQVEIVHYGGKSSGGDFNLFPLCQAVRSEYYYFKKHHKGINSFIVKLLLSVALIARAPWFLYHCHIFNKQNKNINLLQIYHAILMNIITGRLEK